MLNADAQREAIDHYILTGEHDELHPGWQGDFLERGRRARDALLSALVDLARVRAEGRHHPPVPALDLVPWTRAKLTPTVHGLFAPTERETVLGALEASVIFLTSDTIERLLLDQTYLSSAWTLANLYLSSVGANLLGPDARALLGLSEGTTSYVSASYFACDDGLNDYVLHEAAHAFHNCKRHTVGLPATKNREWLLPVEYRKRETFAYACEAYGCIVQQATTRADRLRLAQQVAGKRFGHWDETVDPAEVADIVRAACEAHNGWQVILRRCSPPRRRRARRESASA